MEVQEKNGVVNGTMIQGLADEARQVVGNAILHHREAEVQALLQKMNEWSDVSPPTPELFEAARYAQAELADSDLHDVIDMLHAIVDGADTYFAGAGAALYGVDNALGNVLAAFAFDPDDCEPGVPEACRHAIMQLAVKWQVALPASPRAYGEPRVSS